MGKFFKRKNKKNEQRKQRRLARGIFSNLNNLWKEISKPAGIILFNQIWESNDLTKLELNVKGIRKKIVKTITNKYKSQMLGYKYSQIYSRLKKLIKELKKQRIEDQENFLQVKKDLKSFYKHPLSYDTENQYPVFRNKLKHIFGNIEREKFVVSDVNYLEKVVLVNLHNCEFLQKQRFLQMWGLA